jgi:manganese transport protein
MCERLAVPGSAVLDAKSEEVHGTVAVPDHQAGFWQQLRAFAGPAVLVSVGYMAPGNSSRNVRYGALVV